MLRWCQTADAETTDWQPLRRPKSWLSSTLPETSAIRQGSRKRPPQAALKKKKKTEEEGAGLAAANKISMAVTVAAVFFLNWMAILH